jgi:hypothetical protein
LAQHVVGDAERFDRRRFLVVYLKKFFIGIDQPRVDERTDLLIAGRGLIGTHES